MTQIQFLHGTRDRLAAAATWLREACRQRATVVVFVPDPDSAERLDRLLWTQPATGFLPHCQADSPLAGETPIVLSASLDGPTQNRCLLNLADELPPDFSRFESLVEIVSTDDRVRLPARERFRHYRDQGCRIESRDLSAEP